MGEEVGTHPRALRLDGPLPVLSRMASNATPQGSELGVHNAAVARFSSSIPSSMSGLVRLLIKENLAKDNVVKTLVDLEVQWPRPNMQCLPLAKASTDCRA